MEDFILLLRDDMLLTDIYQYFLKNYDVDKDILVAAVNTAIEMLLTKDIIEKL